MEITIRPATKDDFGTVSKLLYQIAEVHRLGRPDLFKSNARKYSEEEFHEILKDPESPVFVAQDTETERVLGYAFCKILVYEEDSVFKERRSLYLDDLCVDETIRGAGIGRRLMDFLKGYAARKGCYNIELNVWECNPAAISFYEKNGFKTQRRHVEWITENTGNHEEKTTSGE